MTKPKITPFTPQQVFDNALNGVRAQEYVRSESSGVSCSYRGDGGLKCGIGHSIPDEAYNPEMDCSDFSTAINDLIYKDSKLKKMFKDCEPELLQCLQDAHDCMADGNQFEDAMHTAALRHNLVYTKPTTA